MYREIQSNCIRFKTRKQQQQQQQPKQQNHSNKNDNNQDHQHQQNGNDDTKNDVVIQGEIGFDKNAVKEEDVPLFLVVMFFFLFCLYFFAKLVFHEPIATQWAR
mmetsp:Transcript_23429/g.54427  ORF Transcript_23429/g.54427 Transcript_23429/m.54427 type:complete len:104 (+) Transcript_23429:1605-1916(+)